MQVSHLNLRMSREVLEWLFPADSFISQAGGVLTVLHSAGRSQASAQASALAVYLDGIGKEVLWGFPAERQRHAGASPRSGLGRSHGKCVCCPPHLPGGFGPPAEENGRGPGKPTEQGVAVNAGLSDLNIGLHALLPACIF